MVVMWARKIENMTDSSTPRPRVAVVFGGRSGEHQISCATAAAILRAIDRDRFDVLPIGITPQGQWVRVPDDPELFEFHEGRGAVISTTDTAVHVLTGSGRLVEIPTDANRSDEGEMSAVDLGCVDVVFPLLHGSYGEDGTIQGLLEMSDLRYVGCGVQASAVAMDKHLTKTVLAAAGIPVGRWTIITDRLWNEDPSRALEQAASVGSDVYVKPSRAGSSLGITHVTSVDDLADAIEYARKWDPRVIVEASTPGREIECGVLDRVEGGPAASVCGEISMATDGFYDYHAKYQSSTEAVLSCPADLPEDVSQRIRTMALEVFDALGCEGIARVDFFYNPDTHVISVNEVNTMPGFTPASMYPTMWRNTGLTYRELISELIDAAMTRRIGLR